jgi:uncharacterized protein
MTVAASIAAAALQSGSFVTQAFANSTECAALTAKYAEAKPTIVEIEVSNYVITAAKNGCVELTRTLLVDGGSVIMQVGIGDTALHHAAEGGEVEIAQLLIERGADVNKRDLKGSTALFLAAENNQLEMVQFLLERKADPNIIGRSDSTTLSAAVFSGSGEIVDLLLEHGVDAKAVDSTGKSAILYAAARGFAGLTERLLKAGVDVNAVYANNLTALMWAAGFSEDAPEDDGIKTVTLLLDKGAKIDAQDDRGYTALITAAELGHDGVVALLLKRGADRTIKSKDGKAAADVASTDAAKVLLK